MPLLQGDPQEVGRYRLRARLGAGGMGVVYLGEAPDGQRVAVKVLRPEYAGDPEFRARFQREAAAIGRVRNDHTVRVIDADTDSATPFLATEFADGPSLSEHVKANGPLPPESVFDLASALADALAGIHAAGVSHRDLKPSNVLLTGAGPKVIDFGIAQLGDGPSITRTGITLGSPGYMAPEQVTGHGGQEADVFAWALIVAFAASGRPPFGGGETIGILHRILHEEAEISAVPPPLMPLVAGALAKDPALRPTAADLVRDLPVGAAGAFALPTATSAQTAQRRRSAAIVAAAALVVLAATGAALLTYDGSQPGGGPAAGPKPSPSVTRSASAGGQVAYTRAPVTQRGTAPGASGLAASHKRGTAGAGGNKGGAALSRPSARSATTSPSGSASTSSSPTESPSASTSPSSSPTASPSPSTSTGTPSSGSGSPGTRSSGASSTSASSTSVISPSGSTSGNGSPVG